MSEENQNPPAIIPEPQNDFSPKELEILNEYMAAGLPGIAKLDEVKMATAMDMYLSGRTYRQISSTTGIPKSNVLYLSHRFNWFQLRQDYLMDLESNIRGRVMEAKIVNQDFLLQLQQMWQKKIGSKIAKYLSTNDEEHTNSIDLKEVDKYLKTIETLERLSSEKSPTQRSPTVGLNLGDGVTIVKKGDNEVEITPKAKAISSMLKQTANMIREEEDKLKK